MRNILIKNLNRLFSLVVPTLGLMAGSFLWASQAGAAEPQIFSLDGKIGWFSQEGLAVPPVFEAYEVAPPQWVNSVIAAKQNKKWGLIDAHGQWIKEPVCADMSQAGENGLWPAKQDGKWGYLTSQGTWKIEPRFSNAWLFIDNRALVEEGSSYFYIDPSGEKSANQSLGLPITVAPNGLTVAFREKNSQYYPPLFSVSFDAFNYPTRAYNCYMDKDRNPLLTEKFQVATAFNDHGFAVASALKTGKYGIINTQGEWTVQPAYQAVALLEKTNLATYQLSGQGKFGLVAVSGAMLSKDILDEVKSNVNGMVRIKRENRYGLLDASGTPVVNTIFDSLEPFSDTLFLGKHEGKYGLVGPEGKWHLVPYFTELFPISDGLGAAKIEDKWGFVDAKGAWSINPQFEGASSFSHGLAPAKANGKWGYINTRAEWVFPPIFEKAEEYNGVYGPVVFEEARGFALNSGVILYETQICGAVALKDGNHAIAWPPLDQVLPLCKQYGSKTSILVKY